VAQDGPSADRGLFGNSNWCEGYREERDKLLPLLEENREGAESLCGVKEIATRYNRPVINGLGERMIG